MLSAETCGIAGDVTASQGCAVFSGVGLFLLDKDWSLVWFVFKRRYRACKYQFETRFSMRHNLLAGWLNAKHCSIVPADRGGLYRELPTW